MSTTTGIVLFDGAEELDYVGPWEVFTMAAVAAGDDRGDRVVMIAESDAPITSAKGMRVLPDCTFGNAPELDVVLVPGGEGTRREMKNRVLLDWLGEVTPGCDWVTSVCTGALVLRGAGLLEGKRATTHWSAIDLFRDLGDVEVLDDVRYVRDGNVVTAAGVSAGIDMSLWLVGRIYSPDHARLTQRLIEYDPAPPYAAEA